MFPITPQTIFALAHTDLSSLPLGNGGRTMRLVVRANVYASAVSIVFANHYNEAPLLFGEATLSRCDGDGKLITGTVLPVTMAGSLQFALAKNEQAESDPVAINLKPGDHIALSVYWPQGQEPASGNWLGNKAARSRTGNFCTDLEIPGPHLASRFVRSIIGADMAVQLTGVSQLIAHCETPSATVACFGDSITQQCTWFAPLEKRLHKAFPGKISLCNLGIAGNRLLREGAPSMNGVFGEAGLARFERDMLRIPGLTHAIIEIGANDVGQPGFHGVPVSEVCDPADYASGMTYMAEALHARGVKVYAATIPPRSYTGAYDEERDAVRREMNAWLRTAPCFDAVLDFEAAVRRTDGLPGMRDKLAQPDGLHPTPLGGLWIARSIPLRLFAPKGGSTNG